MRAVLVPTVLLAAYAAVFGAAIASFLGVVGERVPRGESINGRSHCVCGRQLRASENIPVLGWLRARGRAACCGARIPVRYALAEAGLALWFAAVVLVSTDVRWLAVAAVAGIAVTLGLSWRRPSS